MPEHGATCKLCGYIFTIGDMPMKHFVNEHIGFCYHVEGFSKLGEFFYAFLIQEPEKENKNGKPE